MSVRDNLIAARALIDTPEKWGKGHRSFMPPKGKPLCAAGACGKIGDVGGGYSQMHFALCAQVPSWVVPEEPSEPGSVLPFYNDHPDTPHADIMALFDRAIAAAEQDHA